MLGLWLGVDHRNTAKMEVRNFNECCVTQSPRGSIYTTIMELGPTRSYPLWFWGPNSIIIVVYMDPLGEIATPSLGETVPRRPGGRHPHWVVQLGVGPRCSGNRLEKPTPVRTFNEQKSRTRNSKPPCSLAAGWLSMITRNLSLTSWGVEPSAVLQMALLATTGQDLALFPLCSSSRGPTLYQPGAIRGSWGAGLQQSVLAGGRGFRGAHCARGYLVC